MCVKVLHQVNALLTTNKLLLADGEHAPALQHLRVGAAGVDAGQEGLFCHPDGKPLQLAVAQQAGGVQTSARREDRKNIIHNAIIAPFMLVFFTTFILGSL